MSYRAPLAQGAKRYRVRRATVAMTPETFALVRERAKRLDQSFSAAACELIEQALSACPCADGPART